MCCNVIPRRLMLFLAAAGLLIGVGRLATTDAQAADDKPQQAAEHTLMPAALDFEVNRITGEKTHLSQYYGDVVLIVNTASKCGNTPQYKPLQKLHEDHHKDGLSILGFPANNFGKQEPGSNDQIIEFCEKNYGVGFDMFEKVSVKGDDICPLYAFLTSKETNPEFGGEVRWNFDKFLIGRDGKVIARFNPRTKPDAKEVTEAIAAALKQPKPSDVEQVRAVYAPKDEAKSSNPE